MVDVNWQQGNVRHALKVTKEWLQLGNFSVILLRYATIGKR